MYIRNPYNYEVQHTETLAHGSEKCLCKNKLSCRSKLINSTTVWIPNTINFQDLFFKMVHSNSVECFFIWTL